MGADFQNAFYAVFALPVAAMLAWVLAGTITLSILRLIVGAFSFWRPRRSGDKF